ncbi:hypothetical protein EV368DRAFT_17452, partial [Lentinula lateritia]
MRLKGYLSFDTLWGGVVDALLAHSVPQSERNVPLEIRTNIFLQPWQTYQNKQQIPRLKSMLDIAKKYGLRIEGIAFSRTILQSMPIWYHKEANAEIRSMNHTNASICLRTKHQTRTVGDALNMTNRLQHPDHEPTSSCQCTECTELREAYNCQHPHGCMNQALKLLNTLPEKWDPRSELPEDYQIKPVLTDTTDSGVTPFNANITTTGSLANIFRIFTDQTVKPRNILPRLRPQLTPGECQKVIIATDGSCENNGERNVKAGVGVFIAKDHPENRSAKLPNYIPHSNQTGEIVAVKIAAEVTNP